MEHRQVLWSLILVVMTATSGYGYSGSKRAPLSVNQPLNVLSEMVGPERSHDNPLLAIGKRGSRETVNDEDDKDDKRASLSVNQPMSILSDMYGGEEGERNPLLALGKRGGDRKRAPLSVNQPLTVLSDMYGDGESRSNPLLALGKRNLFQYQPDKRVPLSVNQALHVLSDMYGEQGNHGGNPLVGLGKRNGASRGLLHRVLYSNQEDTGPRSRVLDEDMDWSEGKRAHLSVNQPLSVLSDMYDGGGNPGENPLLTLGKRTALSVNQPLSVLSRLLKDKQKERNMLLALGKRPDLPLTESQLQGHRRHKGLPMIFLGKRAPLSVNSAIAALSDIMDSESHRGENPLLALGK